MKLSNLIPTADQIKLAQGLESQLLQRRKLGTVSGMVAVAWAIIQILISLGTDYLENLGQFISGLFSGMWQTKGIDLSLYEFLGILFLVFTLGAYFLYRWTSFHLKEAEEPFRYTFWINELDRVKKTPGTRFRLNNEDRFHLLHHDLMERLNQRIQRFSLLNADTDLADQTKEKLSSHIYISGDYAIRENKDGIWLIHVMPRVRVGAPDKPATLAHPVMLTLTPEKYKKAKSVTPSKKSGNPSEMFEYELDNKEYDQVIERVYSSIATEIYRQIQSDVKEKISLFPTKYQRAVSLFHEAKDFERSNTIDSYDCAIELYRDAKRYFDTTNIKWISQLFLRLPLLWRLERKFLHMYARTLIGYSRCMIYRRIISALSGRSMNPLFEVRSQIERAIDWLERLNKRLKKAQLWKRFAFFEVDKNHMIEKTDLKRLSTLMAFLTYPKDSILRHSKPLFDKLRESLFDAHVVAALAFYYLGAVKRAEESLENAKAVSPDLSLKDPLYLLAAAEIEPNLDKEILLFKKATELAPNFEIAQYRLAYYFERRFRDQNELIKTRAESVINEYKEVCRINPGNIASYAAQGYIWWLLGENEDAKRKFEEGRDVKAVVRQTFIGELNYGLARIAAEEGHFNKSYDLFSKAISADPEVGAYSATHGSFVTASYYDYIGHAMLEERYKPYKEKVIKKINNKKKKIEGLGKVAKKEKILDDKGEELTLRILNVVQSFVLNDYGNVCLNYFHRFGDQKQLDNAIKEAFKKATEVNPDSAIAFYNLHNAYAWNFEERKIISETIKKAEKLAPAWPFIFIVSAQSLLNSGKEEIKEIFREVNMVYDKIKKLKTELKEKEDIFAKTKERRISTELIQAEPKKKETRDSGIYEVPKAEPGGIMAEIFRRHVDINERMKSIGRLYDGAKKNIKSQIIDVVLSNVDEIVNRTKLSSMFKGYKFKIDGRGVNKLPLKSIQIDRLDEIDVEALVIWANVLSNNCQEERAFKAAVKLSDYILTSYYTDNYDVNMNLREMYIRKRDDYRFKQISQEADEGGKKVNSSKVDYEKEIKECDRKINDYAEVIKPTISNWLKQDPVYYAALNLAQNYFDLKESVEFCDKAIKKTEPNNEVYLNIRGNTYFKNRVFNKSIDDFQKAIQIEPRVALYHANLGNVFMELKKSEKAEASYREAVSHEPSNAAYQNTLGNIYYGNRYYNKSIECYKKAIQIEPQVAVYRANLGGAYRELRKWKEAEKAYLEAIKIEPDSARCQNELGAVYYGSNNYEKAIVIYKKAIEIAPNVPKYRANLILAYKLLEKKKEEAKAYQEAIDVDSQNADYQRELGNAFYWNRDMEKAIDCYKRAIKVNPKVALCHANLGAVYRELKRLEEAKISYHEAVELEPDNAGYLSALGNIYFESGDYEKSTEHYKKAIQIEPQVAVYRANLGGAYRELWRWKEAEKVYLEAIKIEPDNADYQNALGLAYHKSRDYEKAIVIYKKAIEIAPNVPKYRANLILAYKLLEKKKEAAKAYQEAIDVDSQNADYQVKLGHAFYWNRDMERAIDCYKRAIKVNPKVALYHAYLGAVYNEIKRLKEAKIAYDKAVELEPDNADYQNALGVAHHRSGDYEKAVGRYKKAIKIAPRMAVYHANLVFAYTLWGKREEVERAYQEAIAIERSNPTYQHELGNAYYANGDNKRAANQYLRAIKIKPEIKRYTLDFIQTCEQLKDLNLEKSLLEKALQVIPDSIEISQAIEKLKKLKKKL